MSRTRGVTRSPGGPPPSRRALLGACLLAAAVTMIVAGLGVGVRAAWVGETAVDEPQYLLTAISLWEDGDLDISDERAATRHEVFHEAGLPVQTSVLEDGRRVSPHDPLLPLLLSPAMAAFGYLGAKAVLVAVGGAVAALTTWLAATRLSVALPLAAATATVAGSTAPLAVYAHQVYPEIVAALAVLLALLALLDRPGRQAEPWAPWRTVLLLLAITALPWLAVKYAPVAAGLALLGLIALARRAPRQGIVLLIGLAASGLLWLAAHRWLYGGWTAYATGDHFESSGEIGVVGTTPNLLGRSTRSIGLLTDADYGLLAWQPAWLLVIPAVGFLLLRRDAPARWTLLLPLALGWLTATVVALTMHGYWWPGRQLVVVLPVAVLAVAVLLDRCRARWLLVTAAVLALAGLAVQAGITVAGHRGALTWVGAPDLPAPWPHEAWRSLLPDYRVDATGDWVRHAVWVLLALALLVLGSRIVPRPAPADAATTTDPITATPVATSRGASS